MSVNVPKPKQRLWPIVLILLLIAIGLFVANALFFSRPQSDKVFLKSPVAGQNVQMFADPGSGADAFADFPHRTRCTKLDGPIRADLGGVSSDYYHLTCDGTTGYVNAKWVSFD